MENFLQRAAVARIIVEEEGPISCSQETLDLLTECCTEFIQLLSSEASGCCLKQNKTHFQTEHILQALDNLGFEDFTKECKKVAEDLGSNEEEKEHKH